MKRMSRRTMIRLGMTGAVGLAAAACTDTSGTATGRPTAAAPAKRGMFRIPAAKTKLPTANVKLRWLDPGDVRIPFFSAFNPAYHKKHPNITIDYTPNNWNTISQQMTLGLRNGSAPDVFELPGQIPTNQAVTNHWIGAWDDVIPDFQAVKKRFPSWSFANGVTDFDGKTYIMPLNSTQRFGTLLLFNRDYTRQAGYDLDKDVISWDQLRSYAKALTKQGGGTYYGLMLSLAQPGGISGPAGVMATMAGVANGIEGIDWKTGEYSGYADPRSAEILELFLAMRDDGSIHPDSASLDAPGARNRMPQGQSALYFQGPWNIGIWKQQNPDFHFGLNIPPQRDTGDISPVSYGPGGTERWAYYAKSELSAVAGDIFSYFCTLAGQLQWVYYSAPGLVSAFPEAMKQAKLDALSEESLQINDKYMVIAPEPAVRKPDVQQVYLEQVPPSPSFSDLTVGLYTKQIDKSVEQVLREAKDAAEKSLDKAIQSARKKGYKVSREDFVFSDWNPRKPYDKLYSS